MFISLPGYAPIRVSGRKMGTLRPSFAFPSRRYYEASARGAGLGLDFCWIHRMTLSARRRLHVLPSRISKTKLGSRTASYPSAVGDMPVSFKKDSTCLINCSEYIIGIIIGFSLPVNRKRSAYPYWIFPIQPFMLFKWI